MTPRRRKPPHSTSVLQRWVAEQAHAEGIAVARLQRWVSFMVVLAALERMRASDNAPLFVVKGGVAMELRFGLEARATKDLDTAVRGAHDTMLARLDDALRDGHGDFTLSRGEPESLGEIGATRVDIKLAYRGRSWGTVQLELASAEGASISVVDLLPAIAIDRLGLEGPERVACLPVRYQIAQKLHACTERFGDGRENTRFRDLIDLLLLRGLVRDPDLPLVRNACVETFRLRGKHPWPPTLTVPASWVAPFAAQAATLMLEIRDVATAAERIRTFIDEIE